MKEFTGSVPGLGRLYMPQSKQGHAPQLLSLCCNRACTPQHEKPPPWEARTVQLKSSRRPPQLEKSPHSNEDPEQPKINKIIF